jgi:hypothetical protein
LSEQIQRSQLPELGATGAIDAKLLLGIINAERDIHNLSTEASYGV